MASQVLSTSACVNVEGTKNIMDVLHNALRLGEINRDLTPIFQRSSYPRGLPGIAINRLVSADTLEFCRCSVQLEGDLPGVVGKNINLPDGWFWQARQGVESQRFCAGVAQQ